MYIGFLLRSVQCLEITAVTAIVAIGEKDPVPVTDQYLIVIIHVFESTDDAAVIKFDFQIFFRIRIIEIQSLQINDAALSGDSGAAVIIDKKYPLALLLFIQQAIALRFTDLVYRVDSAAVYNGVVIRIQGDDHPVHSQCIFQQGPVHEILIRRHIFRRICVFLG